MAKASPKKATKSAAKEAAAKKASPKKAAAQVSSDAAAEEDAAASASQTTAVDMFSTDPDEIRKIIANKQIKVDHRDGLTPLQYHIHRKNVKCVKAWLECPSLDIYAVSESCAPDSYGTTLFHAPYTALEHAINHYSDGWCYGEDIMPDDDAFEIVEMILMFIKKQGASSAKKAAGMNVISKLQYHYNYVKDLNNECGCDDLFDEDVGWMGDPDGDPSMEYDLWDQLIAMCRAAFK
jgi:hypothetical protein